MVSLIHMPFHVLQASFLWSTDGAYQVFFESNIRSCIEICPARIKNELMEITEIVLLGSKISLEVYATCHVTNSGAMNYDVMKWKHFKHYWPFVRGIHRSPVDSLHKGPVIRHFDVSFDVSLCKLLNKQSRDRYIKMSWRSFDVTVMTWLEPIMVGSHDAQWEIWKIIGL